MKEKVFFIILALTFPILMSLVSARTSSENDENCYCRLPCQPIVGDPPFPEIIGCQIYDKPPEGRFFKCPGWCKNLTANIGIIRLTVNPTVVPPDGLSTSTITASLLGFSAHIPKGNISNITVTFNTTLGELSSQTCVTNARGMCSVTIKSSQPGVANIITTAPNFSPGRASVRFERLVCGWCGMECMSLYTGTDVEMICPPMESEEQRYYDCKLVGNKCEAVPKDPNYPPYGSCRNAGGFCVSNRTITRCSFVLEGLCPADLKCCKPELPRNDTVCILPFLTPKVVRPGEDCPIWRPPSIRGFGLGISQDFSDFVYLRIGIVERGFSGQATTDYRGFVWIDNTRYDLKNIILNTITKTLSADIYSSDEKVGSINLQLNQRIRGSEGSISYRDIATGDMLFYDNTYKVYIIGKSGRVPFPSVPPLR